MLSRAFCFSSSGLPHSKSDGKGDRDKVNAEIYMKCHQSQKKITCPVRAKSAVNVSMIIYYIEYFNL